jgi:hypothetical protein
MHEKCDMNWIAVAYFSDLPCYHVKSYYMYDYVAICEGVALIWIHPPTVAGLSQ